MADNLTVSIGADTSRLRAELALAQAQVKAFTADLRVAAQAANAGTGGTDAVKEFAAQAEAARARVAALQTELRAARTVIADTSHWKAISTAVGEVHKSFKEFGASLTDMADRIFPHFKEIFALTIGAAAFEAGKFAVEANKSVQNLKEQAAALGLTTQYVETYRAAFAKANVAEEDADRAIGRLLASFGKVQEQMINAAGGFQSFKNEFGSSVEVFKGGQTAVEGLNTAIQNGVVTWRGGQKAAIDFADPWKAVGVDLRRFVGQADGATKAVDAFGKGWLALQKVAPAVADTVAKDVLGKSFQRSIPVIAQFSEMLKKAKEGIEAGGGFTSPEEIKKAEEFATALTTLRNSFGRLRDAVGVNISSAFTKMFDTLNQMLGNNAGAVKHWAEETGKWLGEVVQDLVGMFQGKDPTTEFGKDFLAAKDRIVAGVHAITAAFRGLMAAADAVASVINSIFGTEVSGNAVAITVAVGAMSGAFTVLATGISLAVTALTGLVAVLGGPITAAVVAIGVATLAVIQNWDLLKGTAQAFWDMIKAIVSYVGDVFARVLQSVLDRITAAAAAVKQTLSSSFPGDPGGAPAMPMAGGGMIRGPGTGTSDSILARLSNGEFVMRASAVQAWGADFMRSINSFADGGLVRPVPRFADGGLVAGAGGRPVHLHLGGNSFALSGSDSVVTALVGEAHRQHMRSAGTKPSWFAGRPSGH